MATEANPSSAGGVGGTDNRHRYPEWPLLITELIKNRVILGLLVVVVIATLGLAASFLWSCDPTKVGNGSIECKESPPALPPTATSAGTLPETPAAPTAVGSLIQSPTSTAPISTASPAAAVDPTLTPPAPAAQCSPLDANLPRNAQLIKCTWDFWNEGRYVEAVAEAQECIAEFEGQALREQQALSLSGQPEPIIGAPASAAEKTEILARGVLNDVAACHFALGQALQKLERMSEAKTAYKDTLQFPHARVWDAGGDPGGLGFFWSPAQTAADRLAFLP